MRTTFTLDEMMPRAIFESATPKMKLGYPKFLAECVGNRTFLESSALVANTLGRIADKTLMAMEKENSADPVRFNALSTFEDKITRIREDLMEKFKAESDPKAKQHIASLYSKYKFLSNPFTDGILKNALAKAKKSPGHRLATFIKEIIIGVSDKSTTSPIEAFKQEVTHLKDAIEMFYNPEFPYQATLKGYKDALLGENDGLIEILDTIADNLNKSRNEIQALNSNVPKFTAKDTPSDVFVNHQTNQMLESERVFMEAFAESLSYFSRS